LVGRVLERVESENVTNHGLTLLPEKDRLRKSDTRKELAAWLVVKKTAVTQEWIASHLSMGNRSNVGRAIQRIENGWGEKIIRKKDELEEMSGCAH